MASATPPLPAAGAGIRADPVAAALSARSVPRMIAAAGFVLLAGCAGYGDPYSADKVTICHKGTDTLVVPENKVSAHLGHGDVRGPCE